MEKGLIQIYTGSGKGKTTAAVGQAVRAAGHGLKPRLVYFHKNPEKWRYGEFKKLEELGIKSEGFAKKHPHFFEGVSEKKMRKESVEGLKHIRNIFKKDEIDLLILDEILISYRDGYLEEEELLQLLEDKPEDLEVILTGRGASEKLIEAADLVSRMENVKHPLEKGVGSRKGIDY